MTSEMNMVYFDDVDVLHVTFASEAEHQSFELAPNVTVELNAQGELIGIEILQASAFIRDFVLESFQAKLLQLPQLQPA